MPIVPATMATSAAATRIQGVTTTTSLFLIKGSHGAVPRRLSTTKTFTRKSPAIAVAAPSIASTSPSIRNGTRMRQFVAPVGGFLVIGDAPPAGSRTPRVLGAVRLCDDRASQRGRDLSEIGHRR